MKRSITALGTALVLCLLLSIGLFIRLSVLKLKIAYADGQVAIFDDMKASANLIENPQDLAGKLAYVVNYYPSGSKQAAGTHLDKIVESARSNAIAGIIARLRTATGKDLGVDPQKWLAAYPPNLR
jgi:hypothetical protein